MADYADKALLINIRPTDNALLNFSDSATITGSFSLSDTLAPTLPFGPLTGAPATSGSYQNSAAPGITGTSSPVMAIGLPQVDVAETVLGRIFSRTSCTRAPPGGQGDPNHYGLSGL